VLRAVRMTLRFLSCLRTSQLTGQHANLHEADDPYFGENSKQSAAAKPPRLRTAGRARQGSRS